MVTLAKRVIPCLDVTRGRVVKGIAFVDLRDAGDPAELAARYDEDGADELVFLDITASSDGRAILLDVVRRAADRVFIPLTVGGGVRTIADIAALLRSGADKVSLNTAALERPALINEAANAFGSQCVVVALDSKRVGGHHVVHARGGRVDTGRDAIEWASEAVARGAGEILITSIDRDGTGSGYDLELTASIAAAVSVPVVASGGAGTPEHLRLAFIEGGADAALAATIFHFESRIRSRKPRRICASAVWTCACERPAGASLRGGRARHRGGAGRHVGRDSHGCAHEPRGLGDDASYGPRHLLQPLTASPVGKGRDQREHAGGQRDPAGLRCRFRAAARRCRGPRVSHWRAIVLLYSRELD